MIRRGVGAICGAVVVILMVAGCSVQPSAKPSASTTADWSARLSAFVAKYGSNPASDPPFTDAQAHEATQRTADRNWASLLQQYPTAVRPTDAFIHWAANQDPDLAACYTAAGATPETGTYADGTTTTGYSGPATAEFAVATFDCEMVRYPVRQSPYPNRAQLGYYYDYLTSYLIPCYQGHGAKIDLGMPTRSEFITQNQPDYTGNRWMLTPPDAADAPDPTYDGTSAVCSATGPGGAQQ